MKKVSLKVEKREIFGKKLNALRKTNILPGNVYGKDIKSTAVQLPLKEFKAVYDEVGSSGVVYLELGGESKPVLIHALAYDYVKNRPLHADFFQVNLKEKVKTMVPLHVVGEAKAVTEKVGMLMTPVSEIEVEALPTELPDALEIDVVELSEVGQNLKISDIKKPEGVEILSDQEQVIASIAELVSEEAEEQAAEEAAAAEAASEEKAEGNEANAEEVKEEAKENSEEKAAE